MFKVMIADDERIICEGLNGILDWNSYDMQIVAIASDGQDALNIIDEMRPDICLLDICMPFVDGLEITEYFLSRFPEKIVIIVSGHDEFRYAQSALNLGAFSFILKPVDEKGLVQVILKARQKLEEDLEKQERENRTTEYLRENISIIRHSFFKKWLSGQLSTYAITNNFELLDIDYPAHPAFILVRIMRNAIQNAAELPWEPEAELMHLENPIRMLFERFTPYYVIRKDSNLLMIIYNSGSGAEDIKLEEEIELIADRNQIWINTACRRFISPADLPVVYSEALENLNKTAALSPIVMSLKSYIERNYSDSMIKLQDFADKHNANSSYLSRLFKKELHQSFIDYLTDYRIGKSIQMLLNPDVRICQVSEQVGYSSQHYYCESFRRVMGTSPTEYRKLLQK